MDLEWMDNGDFTQVFIIISYYPPICGNENFLYLDSRTYNVMFPF